MGKSYLLSLVLIGKSVRAAAQFNSPDRSRFQVLFKKVNTEQLKLGWKKKRSIVPKWIKARICFVIVFVHAVKH